MKVFISGGNGFIGRRLVSSLLSKKHSVTIYERDGNVKIGKGKVRIVKGDILDYEKLVSAVKGHDVVYHLAGIIDESIDYDKMYEVNVKGTENMLKACVETGVGKFVFASSVGVMGDVKNGPADEKCPYDPVTNYEKTKADAEKLVLRYGREKGLSVTVLRPSIVVGVNDNWRQIVRAVRKRYPYLGGGENHWHRVDVDDVVSAFVLAMKGGKSGEAYIIASDDVCTYKDIVRILSGELGVKPPSFSVPVSVAKGVFYSYGLICKALGREPSLTYRVSSVKRLTRERYYDISKARVELGYKPKYNTEKSLRKMVSGL